VYKVKLPLEDRNIDKLHPHGQWSKAYRPFTSRQRLILALQEGHPRRASNRFPRHLQP
jgi:hypothetical protein